MSELMSYLAGAMDSDGCFGIKKSSYHQRVRKDSGNPVFIERASLKQVTPQIPQLLRDTFGGRFALEKPSCKQNGRPLYSWQATDLVASQCCKALVPHLRVKRQQAETLLELRESKSGRFKQLSYWFEKEHPDWREMEMITTRDAAKILGYKDNHSVSQAILNGSLLALPWDHVGKFTPRVCKPFVDIYAAHQATSSDHRGTRRPPQLIAWRESLWNRVRELNKIGVNGTAIFHRTGRFALT